MNRIIQGVFLIFIFMGVACKKHTDTGKAEPYITNPTPYLLKRQTSSGVATNGWSFLFLYNSDNLVSQIERYQWGTVSIDGGPAQIWRDTAYYTFEYTNGLCTRWSVDEHGKGYFIYKYNDKKIPISRTVYSSDNIARAYSSYKYDELNNMIEKADSTDMTNYKYVLSYNNAHNLISATSYLVRSNPQQKTKYEWVAFDDKVNFIKAINGLPPSFQWDNNYNSYSSSSPNNYLSQNYYATVNIDQPFGQPHSISVSYEYNEAGLPTKMYLGSFIITMEYEKFR